MKKFILPLLLILSISMLIADESEASDVVGYVKYACYSGINYVAVPLGDIDAAEDYGIMYPSISAMYKWNPTAQGWTSISYDDEFEEWDGTMPISNGDVIVFASSSDFSFFSMGEVVPYSYDIKVGYNRISVPLNRSDIQNAAVIGDEMTGQSAIFKWSNALKGWTSISYDDEFEEWDAPMPVAIGDVIVNASSIVTTWPAPPTRSGSLPSNSRSSK